MLSLEQIKEQNENGEFIAICEGGEICETVYNAKNKTLSPIPQSNILGYIPKPENNAIFWYEWAKGCALDYFLKWAKDNNFYHYVGWYQNNFFWRGNKTYEFDYKCIDVKKQYFIVTAKERKHPNICGGD